MSEEKKKFELSPSAAIIIAGIIIAGTVFAVNRAPANQPTLGNAAAAGAAVAPTDLTIRPPSAEDHIIGSPTAPIVLVEYSDFQCPYCSMVYPTLKKIQAESNGQIALVQRQLPLVSIHPNANPAANAAECIAAQLGSEGYWKFADALFADQSKLSDSYYAQVAQQLGADMNKYRTCTTNKTYQSRIDQDATEAGQSGGNGTPFTVVVNTKTGKMAPASGALPEAQFLSIINSLK